MRKTLQSLCFVIGWFILALPAPAMAVADAESAEEAVLPPLPQKEYPYLKVLQLVSGDPMQRQYAAALPTLLQEVRDKTSLNVDPFPEYIESFEDERIFKHPFIHVNFADRQDWTLSVKEVNNLRKYLERGGFIFFDAGINASFLRGNQSFGQMHSFADWQVTPELEEIFLEVFPEERFEPLERNHPFFKAFYAGLPDPAQLPEAIRPFVVNEKWPQGTYSTMGLKLDGRLCVAAMPIMAMGWGQNELGQWTTRIGFRVREGAEGLETRLNDASYAGERFEAKREDGRTDIIFCEDPGLPAWVAEPEGEYRIFRYYHTEEINEYAHIFYTRLGVNLMVYVYSQ